MPKVVHRGTPRAGRRASRRPFARPRPAEIRHRKHERRDQGAHGTAPDGGETRARRVLIVDDESAIRLICRINLVASGWACDEAEDGDEALERIRREPPDIVLLDVMMPVRDGWMV